MKPIYKGIALMTISALAFSFMQILIALTAENIPLFEQIFFRNFLAALLSFAMLASKKMLSLGKKSNLKLLLMRSGFGYLGMITLFFATRTGNQGDVAMLSKLSPFIVIIISIFVFKEKIKIRTYLAVAIAFLGAYITADPSYNSHLIEVISAILASVFAGLAYSMVSMLKGREKPEIIVFFFSVFSSAVSFVIMIPNFVMPTLSDFLLLLGISLFAFVGQITMTYSYTYAKASDVSIFNYTGIPFSIFLGFLLLNQPVKSSTLIGSLFVVLSAVIMLVTSREKKNN